LAYSTCWGISTIEGFQLRHELALLGFTVKTADQVSNILPERVFT